MDIKLCIGSFQGGYVLQLNVSFKMGPLGVQRNIFHDIWLTTVYACLCIQMYFVMSGPSAGCVNKAVTL